MDPADRRAISALMARLADGEREAFTPLFERLWPAVRGFTARVLAHDADADDVAQRAMVSLFARANAYDSARDGLAWALGIAAWECRTLRRRRERRREVPQEAAASVHDEHTPEHALLDAELVAAFTAITGSLDPEDRRALGLEPGEGPASPALRKRKQRALLRLRAVWSRMHGSRA